MRLPDVPQRRAMGHPPGARVMHSYIAPMPSGLVTPSAAIVYVTPLWTMRSPATGRTPSGSVAPRIEKPTNRVRVVPVDAWAFCQYCQYAERCCPCRPLHSIGSSDVGFVPPLAASGARVPGVLFSSTSSPNPSSFCFFRFFASSLASFVAMAQYGPVLSKSRHGPNGFTHEPVPLAPPSAAMSTASTARYEPTSFATVGGSTGAVPRSADVCEKNVTDAPPA